MNIRHDAPRFSSLTLRRLGALGTLLAGLLLLPHHAGLAQSECSTSGCPPGTSTLLFSGTQSYNLLGGPCIIDVTYTVHRDCNGRIEISINKIEWNSTVCSFGTFGGLLGLAYRAILLDDRHTMFPTAGCYDGVRGTSKLCWTGLVNPNPAQNTIVPCNTEGCCTQTFKVCRDDNDPVNRTVTKTGEITAGSCGQGACWPSCTEEPPALGLAR